ncbi:uncharacterized protein PV09_08327 [Verruconis gallopava]|uniref:Heterokaryon incompatibility domain-containing protein n=1 Tax=Verruconis gallopava TaxID=253628 RepID=A0A0D1XD43_9PEZI|nr:uncharacterized protein PV09_08327 [Verruconis gallopava]KIW00151.1 hypothetical protein PV09_08327 [Verruconis gallopava]
MAFSASQTSTAAFSIQYRYQLLEDSTRQIRLLRPDTSGDLLSFHLYDFELSAAPSYYALSYTWGKPAPMYDILLGGRRFSVRRNLLQFLHIFAKRHPHDYIWIDQVCIDQENVAERNRQVQIMGNIYKTAAKVLIWLGEADMAHATNSDVAEREDDSGPWDVSQLEATYSAEYWTRLWIVQEVLSANSIMIFHGNKSIEWSQYTNLMNRSHAPQPLLALDSIALRNISTPILPEIALFSWKDSMCQDPRDHIYALQGLFTEQCRIEVDYVKPIRDVYLDAALMILRTSTSKSHVVATTLAGLAEVMGLVFPDNRWLKRDETFKRVVKRFRLATSSSLTEQERLNTARNMLVMMLITYHWVSSESRSGNN